MRAPGSSVADPDPGSGAFLHLDPGRVKSQDPDPGFGMSNPDHSSKSLETIFWVKIIKFFDANPGLRWKKFGRDRKKSGPG